MVVLISGASHTGKTMLAQKLLEKYKYPYMSLDHLKMGLIRSGETTLTVEDDDELTTYLWHIAKEIVKTAIENEQNLIIEGCYIPFDWAKDFDSNYLPYIKYVCLVLSEQYIKENYNTIKQFASVIENRIDDSYCTLETLLEDNKRTLNECLKHSVNYILIDKDYNVDFEI